MGLTGTPLEKARDEEKMAAIKGASIKAKADGFVTSLPRGYDTPVGERGFRSLVDRKTGCDRHGNGLKPAHFTSG